MSRSDSPEEVGLIWIDARHAAVVTWDGEPVVRWIDSDVPVRRKAAGSVRRGPARPAGGGRVGGHGTESRYLEELRRYLAEVAERVAGLELVEVSGRGPVHEQLADLLRRLSERTDDGLSVTVLSLARRPSEGQLAARLRKLADRELPRISNGPYRPVPVERTASGRVRTPTRDDLPNQKARHLPEREEIDQEVEMMLADDEGAR
jgi:hypothetical protein